jgi:hypothetical protein
MRINGSYASFKNFLGSLEENIRLMDLRVVNFAPASTSISGNMFDFDITLTTYYYP